MRLLFLGMLLASVPVTLLAQQGQVLRENLPPVGPPIGLPGGSNLGRRPIPAPPPGGVLLIPPDDTAAPAPADENAVPMPPDDQVTATPLPPPPPADHPTDDSQQMVPNPLGGSDVVQIPGASRQAQPQGQTQRGGWVQMGAVTLQALDKVNALSKTLVVKVGDTGHFGSLDIGVQGCFVRPASVPADATAYLVIRDHRPDAPSFTGWMVRSAPYMSMLAHPIYDIRIAACTP